MRLLIVDDEPALRDVCARFLSRAGFDVDMAEDGEAAWAEIGLRDYDLILTDENMPRLGGTGLIGRLREAGVDVPVILMTGGATKAAPGACAPDFFLTKPFNFMALIEEVNRLLCVKT